MNVPQSLLPPLALLAPPGSSTAQEFALWPLVAGLAGGLALFLFGMDQLSTALKGVAGDRLKTILARLTRNRFTAVITGAMITAVVQSSSVTTVMLVGFITSGLMTATQSIGVIMGANIGTTVTAQVIAFDISRYALLMIAVGFGMTFLAKFERPRLYGAGIMGLGLVFFGMKVMGDAMAPLRAYEPFVDWMITLETPVAGILAGALFTALVQSSAATAGVVIVMAGSGLISLPAGIALIFGANIGTCATAMLAAIGKPREAVRASLVHVLFNTIGVLLWLPFIDDLARLVLAITPGAGKTPRLIANAHTVFNVSSAMVLVWFAPLLAWIARRLVPDRPEAEEKVVRARYLDNELLQHPSLALDRARLEMLHMGDHVREMLAAILPAVLSGNRAYLQEVASRDDAVDRLHAEIITYLGKISGTALTEEQTAELLRVMEATNDLENIGDIIETNLVSLGSRRIDEEVTVSQATREVIGEFHAAVMKALGAALHAVTQKNEAAALQVVEMKREINRMADSARVHQAGRLVAAEPKRLPTYSFEMDVLENLKRIYYFCKRMARVAVPSEVLTRGL